MPFIQGWSHIALNHPLSFLQHQLFCCGRLTWLHLGARQISACKSSDLSNSSKGIWGGRRRGDECVKPWICYHQSLTAAHTKTRATEGRSVGKGEGFFSPQALEVTSALLYSQSGNGCAIALSRKQPTLCIFGGILFGVQEADSDHLVPSVLLNRNCSGSAWVAGCSLTRACGMISHWKSNCFALLKVSGTRRPGKISPERSCPSHGATCWPWQCSVTRKGGKYITDKHRSSGASVPCPAWAYSISSERVGRMVSRCLPAVV